MNYSKEIGVEFWYEFDNQFLFQPTNDIKQLYSQIKGPDTIRLFWEQFRQGGNYQEHFYKAIQPMFPALIQLSNLQLEVINAHFSNDLDALQLAFEDFGQGILFDDRRNLGDKIHKMDTGGPLNPPIGYHRWHPIIRASVIAGADENLWLSINRFVGLAWAIQSKMKPVEDAPNNPAIPQDQLQKLRDNWLSMTTEDLDQAFESSPYPPEELLL